MTRNDWCECGDPGCPCCHGYCTQRARTTLFRVDIDDNSGIAFCLGCARDALESGVFSSECEDEDFDEDE